MTTLDARLSRLEAAQALERDALAIPEWLAAFRRGDDVHLRNRAGGVAWCEAAAERERLALETLETYDETFNYIPVGAS